VARSTRRSWPDIQAGPDGGLAGSLRVACSRPRPRGRAPLAFPPRESRRTHALRRPRGFFLARDVAYQSRRRRAHRLDDVGGRPVPRRAASRRGRGEAPRAPPTRGTSGVTTSRARHLARTFTASCIECEPPRALSRVGRRGRRRYARFRLPCAPRTSEPLVTLYHFTLAVLCRGRAARTCGGVAVSRRSSSGSVARVRASDLVDCGPANEPNATSPKGYSRASAAGLAALAAVRARSRRSIGRTPDARRCAPVIAATPTVMATRPAIVIAHKVALRRHTRYFYSGKPSDAKSRVGEKKSTL